ncbi:MAG TPA: hypothetical protein VKC66_33940 [Xanthobacteraceae bacterium]|nr:hypothetical protein [Xanthobacteraceae bacterium]
MRPDTLKLLEFISEGTGLLSVLLLYWASLAVPAGMKSWSGESEPEKRWDSRAKVLAWIGVPCAVIAVGCQAIITIYRP